MKCIDCINEFPGHCSICTIVNSGTTEYVFLCPILGHHTTHIRTPHNYNIMDHCGDWLRARVLYKVTLSCKAITYMQAHASDCRLSSNDSKFNTNLHNMGHVGK